MINVGRVLADAVKERTPKKVSFPKRAYLGVREIPLQLSRKLISRCAIEY